MLAQGCHARDVLASFRPEPQATGIVGALPLLGRLDRLITRAGVAVTLGQALLGMALCGSLSLILLQLAEKLSPAPALVLAATLGIGLPVLGLIHCQTRRLRLLRTQLPCALDLVADNLRRDRPLTAALAVVAQNLPDPLGSELGVVVDEVTLGRSLDEALERLSERAGLPELHALTIALRTHPESGSDLARVLERLAELSRSGICCPGPRLAET